MKKTSEYELTIVVPVYNEEDGLARLEESLADYLPKAKRKACVLMVNDGSKDKSLTLIQDICQRQPHFYYISWNDNHGLSSALKAGIDATESRFVGYIDSDLQTNPEDFNLLLDYADDYQLVAGIRAERKDSWFKRFQSKFANKFRRSMTGDVATDTGCPLKVMRTETVQRLPFFNGMHRFLAALFLLEFPEGSYKEIPVRHYPRTTGVSKYNLWNRLIGPLGDCFGYRWMKKRYIRYSIDNQSKAD